jgi:hypothetical protein
MADATKNLWIVVGAKIDGFKGEMSKLNSEIGKAEKDWKRNFGNIGASMKSMGTVMVGVGATVTAAFGLMAKSAIDVEGTRIAFENLAKTHGQSADTILKSLQEVSKGTISANDLMLSANRAMTLGVATNTDQFTALMEIARDRARVMGLTTTQAFNDIVTGIGRGSPLILDNLGIIVNATEANEIYAQSIGKTASELTEAEKQQALLNSVLEQGVKSIDRAAQATMTTSEKFQMLKATFVDTSAELGAALLPLINKLMEYIVSIVTKIKNWYEENKGLANTLTVIGAVLGVVTTAFGGGLLVLGQVLTMIPKITAAWKLLSTLFSASGGPIGIAIAAIGALIAVGVLLYQNWDKVTEFFKTSWEHIKIAFATAIQFIVNTVLLPFVEIVTKEIGLVMTGVGKLVGVFNKDLGDSILGIADKFMNAREHITNWTDSVVESSRENLANAEAQKKVKEAAGEVETATEGSTQATIQNTAAQQEATGTASALSTESKKLAGTIKDITDQFDYSRTAAGQMGLTYNDVINTLHSMGYSTEDITQALADMGEQGKDVNAIMQKFGITNEMVGTVVGKTSEAIKAQTAAAAKLCDEINAATAATRKLLDEQEAAARAAAVAVSDKQADQYNISQGSSQASVYAQMSKNDWMAMSDAQLEKLAVERERMAAESQSNKDWWNYGYNFTMANALRGIISQRGQSAISENDILAMGGALGASYMAKGGEGIVTKPTLFLAGEAGAERYNFTPLKDSGGNTSSKIEINMHDFSIRNDSDVDLIGEVLVRKLRLMGIKA